MANALNEHSQNYKWQVLFVVMIGTLMAALDSSIVNVSIPAMMANLSVGTHDIEWVSTAYMLAFATFMPLTAWFRTKTGHKRLYIGALVVFTAGSVMCALAWSLPSLVAARVFQALGAGAVTPTGMAMITEVFEPRERGKAMGYWGVGIIVGPAIGPTLGGILTRYYGWRSIFMVNLPIGIFGVLLALRLLRADRVEKQGARFDLGGFFFLTLFLVSFLIALSQGEYRGWSSTYIYTCWLLSGLGLGGFLLVQSLVENGVLDLSLLRHFTYSLTLLITFVRSIALFGGTFLLPLFMQQLQGLNEIVCGLLLLPGSLVIALVMPISGHLSDRIGSRSLVLIGLLLLAFSMYQYRNLDVSWSHWDIVQVTMTRGVGFGLLLAPVTALAVNSVPADKVGMASSTLNLIQQVGGSIGIALLTTILDHRQTLHLNAIGSGLDMTSAASQSVLHKAAITAMQLGYNQLEAKSIAQQVLGKAVFQRALVLAFQDAFYICAIIVAVALLTCWYLPRRVVGKTRVELSE